MKDSIRKHTLILLSILFLAGILIIAGCSSSSGDSTATTDGTEEADAETVTTRLVDYTDADVKTELDKFKADYDKVKAKADAATKDDAETVKKDVDQLKTNVEGFDDELAKAVEDSKLTEDAKKGYDTTIETMRTDLDNLDKELDEKMSS